MPSTENKMSVWGLIRFMNSCWSFSYRWRVSMIFPFYWERKFPVFKHENPRGFQVVRTCDVRSFQSRITMYEYVSFTYTIKSHQEWKDSSQECVHILSIDDSFPLTLTLLYALYVESSLKLDKAQRDPTRVELSEYTPSGVWEWRGKG